VRPCVKAVKILYRRPILNEKIAELIRFSAAAGR
jgi:hypothetical protein